MTPSSHTFEDRHGHAHTHGHAHGASGPGTAPPPLTQGKRRVLHIDCRAGMAGDMYLAALAHLGVDLLPLEALFAAAGVTIRIAVHEENRDAGMGRRVEIHAPNPQPMRHLADLTDITERLVCPSGVKTRSIDAFRCLAAAEAAVHGCSVDEIHFHEVGAADTLVDVVGTFWALERLGISRVTSTSLPWFTGTVACEHGVIPLPAPATLELMRGLPVFATDFTQEMITPTGALIIGSLLNEYASPGAAFTGPSGTLLRCGTGYGSRPFPRGLRLVLLEEREISVGGDARMTRDTVEVLESHIDHLTGEEIGHALTALMDAGAKDALWLPGIMKKGRPGGALRVLCDAGRLDAVEAAFFRHTHTLGIRHCSMERHLLPREAASVVVEGRTLPAKAYTLEGGAYIRPEHDALADLARARLKGTPAFRLGDFAGTVSEEEADAPAQKSFSDN